MNAVELNASSQVERLLRQQNRLLKVILSVLAVALLLVGTVACQSKPANGTDRIETGELAIKDKSGIVRARLLADGDNVDLSLYDTSGKRQLALHGGTESEVRVYDPTGQTVRAALAMEKEGPALRLFNAKGADAAVLSVHAGDSAFYMVDPKTDQIRAYLMVEPYEAKFALSNPEGQTKLLLSSLPTSVIYDKNGRPTWSAPCIGGKGVLGGDC